MPCHGPATSATRGAWERGGGARRGRHLWELGEAPVDALDGEGLDARGGQAATCFADRLTVVVTEGGEGFGLR